jgi:3-hydroxyisobutyrate dehydrogenase-like beta-hydroxyacid dehydrogenase
MASRAYAPALGTSNVMLKDLMNAVAVAEEAGVPLPMARAAVERYRLLVGEGKGEVEPSAFIDLLASGC